VTTTAARAEVEAGAREPAPSTLPAPVTTIHSPPSVLTLPRLEVRQSEGLPPESVQTMFRPAVEPLQHCMTTAGGKVNLRVTSKDGVLRVKVEPAASLDPTARECALEALTTVYLEQTASNAGGVSIPPTSFTSLLTLSW